jgi:hypothetical protein
MTIEHDGAVPDLIQLAIAQIEADVTLTPEEKAEQIAEFQDAKAVFFNSYLQTGPASTFGAHAESVST